MTDEQAENKHVKNMFFFSGTPQTKFTLEACSDGHGVKANNVSRQKRAVAARIFC
jgi:hypothetical protein